MSEVTTTLGPEDVARTRLAEFFTSDASWHRRLWTISTPLALREVLEYAAGLRDGLIRPDGLEYVCKSAAAQVRRDHALDCPQGKNAILTILESKHSSSSGLGTSAMAASFAQHVQRCEELYLERWSRHIETNGVADEDAELIARLIAAQLLDEGFSPAHLHRWMKAKTDLCLAELVLEGSSMARRPPVQYQVWIPFTKVPGQVRKQAAERFLTHSAFLEMLATHNLPAPEGVREGAGVLRFDVLAREPRGALAEAELAVRRLHSRCVLGQSGERTETPGHAIVINANTPRWNRLPAPAKIFLPSLRIHSGLFPETSSERRIEDALELLATVESSTTWASIAATWAALEGLLTHPGSKEPATNAADRAADLVTCSLPLAEIHSLKTSLEDGADAGDSEDFLARILAGKWEPTNTFDQAAIQRLKSMHSNPAQVLGRVRGYFSSAFRRLYTQRNMLMHSGRLDSVALPAAMRTMPPLVGAAVDRIIHGLASSATAQPLDVAARATNELSLVGTPGARSLTQLLS